MWVGGNTRTCTYNVIMCGEKEKKRKRIKDHDDFSCHATHQSVSGSIPCRDGLVTRGDAFTLACATY